MWVDLVDLGERLVDEDDRDEDGEALLREACDVTHEGAEVKGDDDEQCDHHPEPHPEPQRHEVYVVFPVGKNRVDFPAYEKKCVHDAHEIIMMSSCNTQTAAW